MEDLNTVNEVQEGVVDPQESEVTETNESIDAGQEKSEESSEVADPKPVQSKDTNSAFAEIRRQKEALETKVKQMDAWVVENYKESHGISTWDEYQTLLAQQKEREMYEEAASDPDKIKEIINKSINDHPAVKEAQDVLYMQKMQKQIAEFKTEYPDIEVNDIEDLNKLPNSAQIYDLNINKGLSLLQAYRAVNGTNKVDIQKIKQEGIKEYIEGLKKNNKPIESGGSSPVIVTETPKTFEEARKGALEMMRSLRNQ